MADTFHVALKQTTSQREHDPPLDLANFTVVTEIGHWLLAIGYWLLVIGY